MGAEKRLAKSHRAGNRALVYLMQNGMLVRIIRTLVQYLEVRNW